MYGTTKDMTAGEGIYREAALMNPDDEIYRPAGLGGDNLVPDGIVLKPPPAVLDDPDFYITKKLPDRVFYRGYPLAEKRENLVGDEGPAPRSEQRAAASLGALLD